MVLAEGTKRRIPVRSIAVTGILAALASVLMFLDFSIPVMPGFIKLDFSELDDGLDDAAFGIQIDLRLIVIADMDIRPKLDASLIRRNFTQKNAEERRLARAVIPDQKGALPFF